MPKPLTLFVLLLTLAPTAWAVDDGQTKPRLTSASLYSPSTSADIIPTTNGSGNVKGLQCLFILQSPIVAYFYVDGAAAQTITISPENFPEDSVAARFTGFIPYNIRFGSSIRVQMQRYASPVSYGTITCTASWALD
ncbi:MAG TPA: hypothetical protein VF756_31760 [Thermoanaerobaculia bacterium]